MKSVFFAVFFLMTREVAASKYTGPKEAEVYVRVEGPLLGAPAQRGRIFWNLEPAATATRVEARVLTVLSYDDNGWSYEKTVPDVVYFSAASLRRGEIAQVHLDYGPQYEGKLAIVGHLLSARFVGKVAYDEHALDPLLRKIKALVPGQTDAARHDRPYRRDNLSARDNNSPLRCVTGEHIVQQNEVTILRQGTELSAQLSELQLHNVEFHERKFTGAQKALLSELLN